LFNAVLAGAAPGGMPIAEVPADPPATAPDKKKKK